MSTWIWIVLAWLALNFAFAIRRIQIGNHRVRMAQERFDRRAA